jgi:conjugal transfer pilus assembly protein TraD
MKLDYDMPWRPTYEFYSALGWFLSLCCAILLVLYSDMPSGAFWVMIGLSLIYGSRRWTQTLVMWHRKTKLLGKKFDVIKSSEIIRVMNKYPDTLWVGTGFDWTPDHTQRVYDIKRKDLSKIYPPKFIIELYKKVLKIRPAEETVGKTWIHGIETRHQDIAIPIKNTEGHSLVLASTGWGKTRFFDVISTEIIHRPGNECLVVLDPKGDKELKEAIEKECIRAGRGDDFLYFHPAHPKSSIRIDPLANWNRATEIASRIASLDQSEDRGGDNFAKFGWRVLQLIAQGLIEVEERPNLIKLKKYIQGGPDALLLRTLKSYLSKRIENWREGADEFIKIAEQSKYSRTNPNTPKELVGLVEYYRHVASKIAPSDTIDGLITNYDHPRTHAQKMLAGLIPTLEMLTAGNLSPLLSPDPDDTEDLRPIVDTKKVIEGGKVLYLALDSLSDSVVSQAIGAIMLADITSVAGDRYNYEKEMSRVNILVDEASASISIPFIEMLSRGRGAGINVVMATQTIPDLYAATGSQDMGRQILGNINNVYCGRIRDRVTMDYVTETFGEVTINTMMHTQSTNAIQSDKDITNYSANYGERLIPTEVPMFSPELLTDLPKFEYIASTGGRIVKGMIPIIDHDE